jgi:two-component system, NarL family, invasion response regulator UvrY
MIRVAIIEELPLIREAIASLLAEHGEIEVVIQRGDLGDLASVARDARVDVVVVGATSDGDAIAAAQRLAEPAPSVRVLALGTGRTVSPPRLLAAGVAGFVGVDEPGRALVGAIQRVHAGERVSSQGAPPSEDPVAMLSPRELQTLRMLAHGMTNREIADRLGISTKTIDTHRGHVLKKLNLRNNSDITRFAFEHGLTDLDAATADAPGTAEPHRDHEASHAPARH